MNKKALCALLLATLAVGAIFSIPRPRQEETPAPQAVKAAEPAPPAALPAVRMDLAIATEQKSIVAEYTGNGRDRLEVEMTNRGKAPLQLVIPAGQMFESDRSSVIVVRTQEVEIAPGKTVHATVQTAGTKSTNSPDPAPYILSYASAPALDDMLRALRDRPEITASAIQTAVLALTENLPLSAVAKFTLASNPLPSRFNTDAFRAEIFDIMTALHLLRDLGVRDSSLAMTVDPQLKIEAMIEPSSRPLAMRYYGIAADREWDFWRTELINGEPCTRHYALYGIARFYPEVALQMLPKWARETRTNPLYRLAAVQALADTQRPEALEHLRLLAQELGSATELGKAATGAADYLDYRLAQIQTIRNSTVAFRNSGAPAEVQTEVQ